MAGGFVAGAVVGKLMLDKSKWSQSINEVKGDEKKMTGMAGRMGAGFKKAGMAMTVAGAAIVGTLGLMVKKFVTAGDEVHKMALRTGFSTEALSELKYACEISGTSITSLEKGIKRMSTSIGEANLGLKTYTDAFALIGIEVKELTGLNPEEQFFKIAEGIAAIVDPTERAYAAQKLLGRAGTELLPLFAAGVEGMEALRQKAREMGIVFDQEAANKAARLADAQVTLKASMQGLTMVIAENIVPMISKFAEGLSTIIAKYSAWAKEHPGLSSTVVKLVAALGGILTILGPIAMILPQLVLGIGMLKVAFLSLLGPIGLIIAGLTALTIGFLKVKAAQAEAQKASERLEKAQKRLKDKLIEMKNAAGMTGEEFAKLTRKYDGNIVAMTHAIQKGKEGKKLQEALAKVGKKHKEAIDKQKKAIEDSSGVLTGKFIPAVIEAKVVQETWLDYLKNIGIKTLKNKQDRIDELEKHLKNLRIAVDNNKISSYDYNKAVNETNKELKTLKVETKATSTLIGGIFAPSLYKAMKHMAELKKGTEGAGSQLVLFARITGQTTEQVQRKFYQLSQSIMGFAGIHIPKMVDTAKAAWPQLSPPPEVKNKWTEIADGIRTQWTNSLSQILQGSKTLGDALGGIWGTVKSQFFDMVASMLSKWTFGFIGQILTGSGGLLDSVKGIFGGIGKALTGSESGEGTGGIFGGLGKSFLGSITKMAGPIGIGLLVGKIIGFKNITKTVQDVWKAVSENVVNSIKLIGSAVTAFGETAIEIFKGVGDVAVSALGAIGDIISGLGAGIGGLLSSIGGLFKKKGDYGDITYWLHLMHSSLLSIKDFLFIDIRGMLLQYQTKVLERIMDNTSKMRSLQDGRFSNRFQLMTDRLKIIYTHVYSDLKRSITRNELLKSIKTFLSDFGTEAIGSLSTIGEALFEMSPLLQEIAENTAGIISAIGDISTAQRGAVLTQPALVMTHGTPTTPEIILPPQAGIRTIEDVGKGKISISIRNDIHIDGTIITDREYTRTRLIPEILDALDANYRKTDWIAKLGLNK